MLQIDTFLVLAVYLKIWQFILRWNILNSHTPKYCLLSISLHFIGFSCLSRDIWTIHSTSALIPFIDSCRPWAHEQSYTTDMRGIVFLQSHSSVSYVTASVKTGDTIQQTREEYEPCWSVTGAAFWILFMLLPLITHFVSSFRFSWRSHTDWNTSYPWNPL